MRPPLPAASRRSRTPVIAVGVIALVVGAGAVLGGYMMAHGETNSAATPDPSPARLHVTDLMAKANCVGAISKTQLFSYETGQCQLAGSRVTIAVFETGELRDQWLASGRGFMNTFVAGVGWAAAMDKPDAAPLLATALGGGVV